MSRGVAHAELPTPRTKLRRGTKVHSEESVPSARLLKGFQRIFAGICNNTKMEKAMAPHSSTLAWKIPWTEEPGRLQSMGSLRVRHD